MANKDLFKQAIAEAKSVREAAIANAKEALEESLTPHLKDMLAAKLQEMEDKEIEEEVVNEVEEEIEEANHDEKEVDEAKDDEKHEAIQEGDGLETVTAEADDEEEEAEEPAEDDSEETEDEVEDAEAEEEPAEDEDLADLSVEEFKDLIRDIIAQEMGDGEAEELPVDDMDAGDIEGMGDEAELDAPVEEPAEDEEEIDLDELLAELESVSEGDDEVEESIEEEESVEEADHITGLSDPATLQAIAGTLAAITGMYNADKITAILKKGGKAASDLLAKAKQQALDEDTSNQVPADAESKEDKAKNINRTVKESADLNEALETIETLKKDLHETNLLNSKLLYVNKIFKANNLTESQKVNVIAAFDKAETVKEVKLVFETVSENIVAKKETTIKEHKGMASKATGTTASKPEVISEVTDAVRRMQKLAGIIK